MDEVTQAHVEAAEVGGHLLRLDVLSECVLRALVRCNPGWVPRDAWKREAGLPESDFLWQVRWLIYAGVVEAAAPEPPAERPLGRFADEAHTYGDRTLAATRRAGPYRLTPAGHTTVERLVAGYVRRADGRIAVACP